MYRKAVFVFSAAAGSLAVGYGIKSQFLKDTQCEDQASEVISTNSEDLLIKPVNPGKELLYRDPGIIIPVESQNLSLQQAINKARDLAYRLKDEVGSPGLVIGVSIDGKTVWKEGLGMANVENRVPCHPDTVMRIASISKSMTMAVVAKLWEEGKLDLDKPVQDYVPSFPKKRFNNDEVTITTRQLVSHLAGIRHYDKANESDENNNTDNKKKKKSEGKNNSTEKPRGPKEFYIKDRFDSLEDSLKLFKDDDLKFMPGKSFLYTTHGWTLVSAVVEGAAKEKFTKIMLDFFQVMGLKNTYLDQPEPLIYNRASYYCKNERGRLRNVPYVDNSYKWAGGGFLSTVGDLLHFGNAMLYSYQWRPELDNTLYPPGYLKPETLKNMWTPVPGSSMKWGRGDGYGMGWVVVPSQHEYGGGDLQKFAVGHTGGAVGASSVLLIVPSPKTSDLSSFPRTVIPAGVTVAIIVNLEGIGLQYLALDVARLFCEAVKS